MTTRSSAASWAGPPRPARLSGRGRDAATPITQIGQWADRVVVDRTGLAGTFDWDLQWTPESLTPLTGAQTTGVPFVTALQEQLGLKFEAERPTAD
jgi:uncharacterized protein (TIGR03435 family)